MKEIQQKMKSKLTIVLILLVLSFICYSFYVFYTKDTPNNFRSIVDYLWKYSLYSSGGVNITLNKIIVAIFFIIVGIVTSRLLSRKIIRKILEKTTLSIGTKASIETLLSYSLVLVFIIIGLNVAEVPLTAFTIFGGALALGLGFGSQNIVNNFISGIILQIEKPVKVGDYIQIDEIKGVVEDIGARSTIVSLSDNTHTIIPNSKILENRVSNWTLKDNVIRSRVDVKFSYSDNPQKVLLKLQELLLLEKRTLKFPEPKAFLVDFDSYSMNYALFFWIPFGSAFDKLQVESDLRIAIFNMAKSENLEIPVIKQEIILSQKK